MFRFLSRMIQALPFGRARAIRYIEAAIATVDRLRSEIAAKGTTWSAEERQLIAREAQCLLEFVDQKLTLIGADGSLISLRKSTITNWAQGEGSRTSARVALDG